MKKTILALALVLLLLTTLAVAQFLARDRTATAAPEVIAGGISGGCYIAAANSCKIHVDPFTVNLNDDQNYRLIEFQLVLNNDLIYHFTTSANPSDRPIGDYTPSLVMQDFAATCGQTYVIKLMARDEGDANILEAARTGQFVCPSTVP